MHLLSSLSLADADAAGALTKMDSTKCGQCIKCNRQTVCPSQIETRDHQASDSGISDNLLYALTLIRKRASVKCIIVNL